MQPVRTRMKFKVPLSQNSVQRCQGKSESLYLPKPLHSTNLSPLHLGRTQKVSPHTKKRILKSLAKSIHNLNHTSAVSSEIGSPGIILPLDSQQDTTAKYFTSTQQTDVHCVTDTYCDQNGEESEGDLSKNVEIVKILEEKLKKSEISFFGLDTDVMPQNSQEDGYTKKRIYKQTSKKTIMAISKKANSNGSLLENKKKEKLCPSSGEKDKIEEVHTSVNTSATNKSISKKKPRKIVEQFQCKLGKVSDHSAQFAKLSRKLQRKHLIAVEHKRKEQIKQAVVRTIKKMHMEIERLLTQRPGSGIAEDILTQYSKDKEMQVKESKPKDQAESYLCTEE